MQGFNIHDWGNTFCGLGPSLGHGPWFSGWIFPLFFWLLIAYLVVSTIKSVFSWKREKPNNAALDVLREKFASGEINEEEYSSRKSVLNSK